MAVDGNPLFSVIIPTKDRAEFLYHTLRTCSFQDYENLEVIVSDDGSSDHTREIIMEAARIDTRIRYVSPKSSIGMRDNFEFALNQVKPGYVLALGGDDGLLPYGIRGMRDVLVESGQEMVAWAPPLFAYAKAKMETGQLMIPRPSKRRIIQSKVFLARQAKNLNYLSDLESPMFYVKGVTSTRLVERVRSRASDGRFYACPTPDGYSGIILAGEVDSYAFSGDPFSIYGASPSSQGAAYLAGDDESKKRSETFFKDVSLKPMHAELAEQPYSPLITLMTVDYLLNARDQPGWPGSFPPIDYKDVLLKSLDELAHGLYSENRLARELDILRKIADQHGLRELFDQRVECSRRAAKKQPFEGNGISPSSLFLDCSLYGIYNILDAAYASHYLNRIITKTSLSTVWTAMVNSVRYKMKSFRKGGHFQSKA